MKQLKIRKITYRLLALLLVATTLWTSSIMASFATLDGTKGQEPICGFAAHTHTQESCYTQTKTLTCELEEDSTHTHAATCYFYENKLICNQTECEPHAHEDGCYTTEKIAACGENETTGHTHGNACYGTESVLTCTNTDAEHEHDTSCWAEKQNLVCKEPECEAHIHEESCYTEIRNLSCGKNETTGHIHGEACYELQATQICEIHVHGDDCYQVKNELTCQLAEHIHTKDCYDLCTCTPVDGVHQEGCNLYEEVCTCDPAPAEGEAHSEGCVFYVPVQMCEHCGVELTKDAIHAEDCLTHCTCAFVDGVHQDGCALYKNPELIDQEISSGDVTVFGKLPETAELAVRALTDTDLADFVLDMDEQIVFAYDISILVDGMEYQPEDMLEVTVPLQVELPEHDDSELSVWHITHDGMIEKVSSYLNEDGNVTFTADSFSEFIGILTVSSSKTDGLINGYIYFDLAAGNVTINNSTYKGYIYKDTNTLVTVSGTHSDSNQYYVYQSTLANRATTGLVNGEFYLPEYTRISFDGDTWGNYVTNNTNPTAVATNWETAAASVGRTSTDNYLDFDGTGKYNVIIDNLWSTKNVKSQTRTTGGISFVASTGGKVHINLKGDNRFGNIHYSYGGSTMADSYGYVSGTGIVFQDAETSVIPGSMTVVSYSGDENHYCSVIGGNDQGSGAYEWSCGIVINSGVIYAGARVDGTYTGSNQVDNCSAIGGGGNGTGVVTIKGGKVTAVVSSTGAAIGGGIGESSNGGAGYVTITGGEIYAYNFGYVTYSGGKPYPVPAAAIGGASSRESTGNIGNVTITGGNVYALSVGGAAIGGGSSTKNSGGAADITISGTAHVTARSIAETVNGVYVDAGVSIGGGTGGSLGSGNGGNAELTIKNGTIKTGSIGGGACTNTTGKIGNAVVEISGGTLQGQVIMAGGADAACKFTMTGGLLDNSEKTADFVFLENNGGAVYMDDPIGEAVVSGGTIQNCSAQNGGAVYMTAGTFTLSNNGIIQDCTASANGGAVYLGKQGEYSGTFTMTGGSILDNSSLTGGAAYLDGGTMAVSGGIIQSNTASAEGGGAYLAGGTLTVSDGSIVGNTAITSGGGAYLAGGAMVVSGGSIGKENRSNSAQNGGGTYLAGGTLTVFGGSIAFNNATIDGGGAYLDGGSLTISGGSITSNSAANNGGGAYISGGDFTLNGESASVAENTAKNGAGVYLTGGMPNLLQGSMENNIASVNGGGIYIDKQLVTLTPTGIVTISGNKTEGNGAGIYIGGTNGTDASFAVDSAAGGQVHLSGNGSNTTDNGGAVCISNGQFTMDADNIMITGNQAINGGGVAVLSGNFSMSAGSIGASGAANLATNGGGVFVDGGTATVRGGTVQHNKATNGGGVGVSGGSFAMESGTVQNNTANSNGGGVYVDSGKAMLSGGTVQHNKATNGGGAGVSGGDFIMTNGTVHNNAAASNGGGVYVSGGDFQMEAGVIGGTSASEVNTAQNGGGVYVADGNVTMINGAIDYNKATANGGGMFVSSTSTDVKVMMLSGSLSHNEAAVNGGGMAVQSQSGKTVTVEIGCLLDHKIGESGTPTYSIAYTGAYEAYNAHSHDTCPVVQSNICSAIGGGFYLDSDNSTLKFYCVIESGNQAADGKENCWGMDVEGGSVIIGDSEYHNSEAIGTAHSIPYGYIQMSSPILVNGGQVDIYGDMNNPYFSQDITVDITQSGDYYLDHRRSNGDDYKIHYVEDFLNPVTNVRSGEYIARQYSDEDAQDVTISSALFVREGYEIKGWYTESNGGGKRYNVGDTYDLTTLGIADGMGITQNICEICGAGHYDSHLLKLYAYWAANGFDVEFDPNVPLGATCDGRMDTQTFTYGSDDTLTKNDFVYPGHFFIGWNTKADGSGTHYDDQAVGGEITNKNGVTIILYAQWEECTHDEDTADCFFTYSVGSTGTVLQRDCSCGGQTLYTSLFAEDTVYDEDPHPAQVEYTDPSYWEPDVIYFKGDEEIADVPTNAGTYTAIVSVEDDHRDIYEISVTYVIEKANQPAPQKPLYEPVNVDSKTVLYVSPVPKSTFLDSKGIDSVAQYRVVYKYDGEWVESPWTDGTAGTYAFTFDANIPLTNYYVESRYKETGNYNPSPASRADQVFYYRGNVTMVLACAEGITGYYEESTDNTIMINLELDSENYYISTSTGDYVVEKSVTMSDSTASVPEGKPQVSKVTTNQYKMTDIPENCTITVTVSGVKPIPKIVSAVTEKQVFGTVTGTSATISQDSAFTAYYAVANYDVDVYQDMGLTFNYALPMGTTIILLNKTNHSYWHYTAAGNEKEVALTRFIRMGGTDNFVVTGTELAYQFIVDFSRSTGGSAANWTMTLGAEQTNINAPVLSKHVNVTLAVKATFAVAESAIDQQSAPTQALKLTYTASTGIASKWDNREAALVLTPVVEEGFGTIPPDTKASVTLGQSTTVYPMIASGKFVIPLSALQIETDIKIALQSNLFPTEDTAYKFALEWIVSNSKADLAPINGEPVVTSQTITFNKTADKTPSLRFNGSDRLLANNSNFPLTVTYQNMAGYSIEAEVLKKFETPSDTDPTISIIQYSGIGMNIDIDRTGDTNGANTHKLSISLNGLDSGSYCVMATVKSGILKVMEVPYYFIIG